MFRYLLVLIVVFLTGCSTAVKDSGPVGYVDVSGIRDAVPRNEPHSKGGNKSPYVVLGKRYYVLDSSVGFRERGNASWYGKKFHGNHTSNGEIYDMYAMTAAHKRLPLPSYVRVTNLKNNLSVVVRVNDRGPFHRGRIIDLSYVAAKKLGITRSGTAPVEIVALTASKPQTSLANTTQTDDSRDESVAVQVGAFSLRSSAEAVKDKLVELFNAPVKISNVYSQGKKLFRVRLGPFASTSDAVTWLRRLDKTSFEQASLVYLD